MASACVNNPTADRAFGWLSPRASFSHDSDPNPKPANKSSPVLVDPVSDPDFIDFEFRLHDPVDAMLPADELFSGGKLVPLHLSKPPPPVAAAAASAAPLKPSRRDELVGSASASDIFAVSPKAPTCTSRWRELLRIKRQQQQQQRSPKPDPGGKNPNPTRSSALKQFLQRRSSLTDPNLSHPLLREPAEPEALSRLSLSSSTSTSSDANEFPRHSLDSDPKPGPHVPILLNRNPPRARFSSAGGGGRVGRSPARRSAEAAPPARCASVDSPRMNASGRVVFQGLGRSSSSPSTFNGGPNAAARSKYKGMERSYSANVRVINVPVPSKAGSVFGFLGPKNAATAGAAAAAGGGGNRGKKLGMI